MAYPTTIPVRLFKQGEFAEINGKRYVPERTCRNVGYYSDSTRFECSECEFNGWVKWAKDGKDRVPGYCPNCGARVKDG